MPSIFEQLAMLNKNNMRSPFGDAIPPEQRYGGMPTSPPLGSLKQGIVPTIVSSGMQTLFGPKKDEEGFDLSLLDLLMKMSQTGLQQFPMNAMGGQTQQPQMPLMGGRASMGPGLQGSFSMPSGFSAQAGPGLQGSMQIPLRQPGQNAFAPSTGQADLTPLLLQLFGGRGYGGVNLSGSF